LITIKQERCTGCGACLDVCPHGALYLLEGKAVVDEALCRECEACVAACPEQAIVISEMAPQPVAEPAAVPAVWQQPEVIRVETEPAPLVVPLRARVLPVFGAALAWGGREIVPRVLDVLLDVLDRRATGRHVTAGGRSSEAPSRGTGGRGRQHRHRRRGGGK
jgi:NAD-dependent dihydropyrimidine dehydrogenase PreA subunit